MVPLCITSLTVGLLMLCYVIFPELFPRMNQALGEKGLLWNAFFCSLMLILMPIYLLYVAVKKEGEVQDEQDEDIY